MLFCKHDWEILSEITSKCVLDIREEKMLDVEIDYIDLGKYSAKKLVQIITCCNCGEVRKFETALPA